jgi:hypothetical protein
MTGINPSASIKSSSRTANAAQDELNPWMKLTIGIALILVFIFGFGRLSTYIPGAQHMARVIDDHDLRATAIFYTDFDTSADSSEYIRHSLAYPPRTK